MRCWQVRRQLLRYEDGDLSPQQAAQVQGHLRACPACRSELAGGRTAVAWVEALDEAEAAPDFSDRVMATIRSGQVTEPAGRRESVLPLWPVAAAMGVGGLVLAAFVGLWAVSIDFSGLASTVVAWGPAAAQAVAAISVMGRALVLLVEAALRIFTGPAVVLIALDLLLLGVTLLLLRLWNVRRRALRIGTMLAM